MVFTYSFFISMVLSLLKLTHICCSDKFTFPFCGIHNFPSTSLKFASNSVQIPFRRTLIHLKMKRNLETTLTT